LGSSEQSVNGSVSSLAASIAIASALPLNNEYYTREDACFTFATIFSGYWSRFATMPGYRACPLTAS